MSLFPFAVIVKIGVPHTTYIGVPQSTHIGLPQSYPIGVGHSPLAEWGTPLLTIKANVHYRC